MRIARVFPRRTNATPLDADAYSWKDPPVEGYEKAMVSVAFTWDKDKGRMLCERWSKVCDDVSINGPAFDHPGNEFVAGRFLAFGHTITSRGCPNRCWFCDAWKREGNKVRELPIRDGWCVHDSNLLACSKPHIEAVFSMLQRQPEKPRFTGGLEAKLLKPWHVDWLVRLKPKTAWFAYDTKDDWEPLVEASDMMHEAGVMWPATKNRAMRCYVLCGWKGDTIDRAERRLVNVTRLGFLPQAMLFNKGEGRSDQKQWRRMVRQWANIYIVSTAFCILNADQNGGRP